MGRHLIVLFHVTQGQKKDSLREYKSKKDDELPMTSVAFSVSPDSSTRMTNGVCMLIGPPFQLLRVRMKS